MSTFSMSGAFCASTTSTLRPEGRGANDLENLGGSGLLLERFAQIIRALPQLIEQACVLDGDNGLSSKVCDQFHLSTNTTGNSLADACPT
jgi:hypothetical protein